MDSTEGMILWVLGGAGITLMYSAFKHRSPLSVLTSHVSPTPTKSASGSDTGAAVSPTVPVSYSSTGAPYSVHTDAGTQYVYDGNGNPTTVLPADYGATPATYIPPAGTINV